MERFPKIALVLSLILFFYSCKESEDVELGDKYAVKGSIESFGSSQTKKEYKLSAEAISGFIQESKKKHLPISQRKDHLERAYSLIKKIEVDSLQKEKFLDIIHAYYLLPDTLKFKELNKELLLKAQRTNDSAVMAKCYWRFGNYYNNIRKDNDSAYYYYSKSERIYGSIGKNKNVAMLLLNMAVIQKNEKDYTGSEITTTKAIAILKPFEEYTILYSCYNNLGIIFNELEDYDKALHYHQEALNNLDKAEKAHLKPVTFNNIGVILHNQGEYSTAISNYRKALSFDVLPESNPRLYAMLLDNLAFAQLKSETEPVEVGLFFQALKIRDSLKFSSGITINKIHLAEYFLSENDTVKALEHLREANQLAEETNNFRDLLASLLMMFEISDEDNLAYFEEFVKISDSLQKEERATRNKFARIRFETDEYISETERLSQRVLQISSVALIILIVSVLLYIISDQRSRNKLIKQKELANQEIYGLILAQQKKFEEGREREKQHISRELHDGVLGKLFGVRISLDSLNEKEDRESKEKRAAYIGEIQKVAEVIRLVSHKLSRTSLVDVDFQVVLEELIRQQNEGEVQFRLDVSTSVDWKRIENETKINLYRIVQEGINNIHNHSGASTATISIKEDDNRLILKIKDNGAGFNYKEPKKGIGLKNMEARVRNLNGKISFNSCAEGATIELILPL